MAKETIHENTCGRVCSCGCGFPCALPPGHEDECMASPTVMGTEDLF
jgi:hypothetical protein